MLKFALNRKLVRCIVSAKASSPLSEYLHAETQSWHPIWKDTVHSDHVSKEQKCMTCTCFALSRHKSLHTV